MNIQLTNPIKNGKIRKSDKWGSGRFGTPRGSRKHNGIDISVINGRDVLSPVNGKVVRKSFPYAKDLSYTGVLIEGTGNHAGISIKIFYMSPLTSIIGSNVSAGDKIGTAQELTKKYPGITNHIHLEVRKNNLVVNPKTILPGIM